LQGRPPTLHVVDALEQLGGRLVAPNGRQPARRHAHHLRRPVALVRHGQRRRLLPALLQGVGAAAVAGLHGQVGVDGAGKVVAALKPARLLQRRLHHAPCACSAARSAGQGQNNNVELRAG
jgi:hypothetical protein